MLGERRSNSLFAPAAPAEPERKPEQAEVHDISFEERTGRSLFAETATAPRASELFFAPQEKGVTFAEALSQVQIYLSETYATLITEDNSDAKEQMKRRMARYLQENRIAVDAEYHNAVFVGTDTDGVPRHAHKRSANSYGKAFRLNVEGSDPRYSFHYVGTDRSLYVFEAPIDMLSFITLYPENWQRHSYVACCGTSIQPVLQMLEQAPQLDTVLLCLDNDEAGNQASRRMQNQLEVRYSVERLIPENKDWNDDLTLSGENAQGLAMNEMR